MYVFCSSEYCKVVKQLSRLKKIKMPNNNFKQLAVKQQFLHRRRTHFRPPPPPSCAAATPQGIEPAPPEPTISRMGSPEDEWSSQPHRWVAFFAQKPKMTTGTPERGTGTHDLTNGVPGGRVELSTPPLGRISRTEAENGHEDPRKASLGRIFHGFVSAVFSGLFWTFF